MPRKYYKKEKTKAGVTYLCDGCHCTIPKARLKIKLCLRCEIAKQETNAQIKDLDAEYKAMLQKHRRR